MVMFHAGPTVAIFDFFLHTINQLHSVTIHIQSNQDADFINDSHCFVHSKKAACSEIANQHIKKLRVALQDRCKAAV